MDACQAFEAVRKALLINGPRLEYDRILEGLERLAIQTKFQKDWDACAKTLRDTPNNKSLPNQQAARIKTFCKWVFEHTDKHKETQAQLRRLDFNSLKFCALCYTRRQVNELPPAHLESLLKSLPEYIQLRDISSLLYRRDINLKVAEIECQPEDTELFVNFKRCQYHVMA